ncbi:MAG: hypothetical protein PHS16_01840 [Candidatus Colwellbacteria bacterium]|nr:hypothetical protein [Candidatus Colwellbacteria bacterium]MCK9497340.1 hypothetical protein [Candidatus Colwellbacteria bacterium]MDD3752660.1 hypothetical protein [Candidatus Colwellbacteria bacterium]MDD4818993.1 hypothetical protein [Candidatus Colwellbacteria bacterium]
MKNKILNSIIPAVALAQTPPVVPSASVSSIQDILDLADRIVGWAFAFFFALAAFFILWAAYDYLTAGGAEAKLTSAKNKLIYAAVGIGIALVARSVVTIVQTFI